MFDNILLPIDLNHPASWETALPMALRLAGDTGKIHILGIVHDLGAAMVASFLPDDFETNVLNLMESELKTFIATNLPKGARAVPHVGHGHIPETILAMAIKTEADLIVMASHPPSDLRSLLVGSYAGKVARHSETPVLVVR